MKTRLPQLLVATLVIGALSTVACAPDSPATAVVSRTPQPPVTPGNPIPGPGPSYTISGVVYDNTPSGRRPVSGVFLAVHSAGFSVAVSDSLGRYTAPVWGDVVVIGPAAGSGFMDPCPSGTDWVGQNPNRSFDVDLVAADLLSTSGLPDSYRGIWLEVSGTVTETVAGKAQPVSGALVALGDDGTLSYSTTLTDSSGHYLVCTAPPGVGTDQTALLTVTKTGFAAESSLVMIGFGPVANITLSRQ